MKRFSIIIPVYNNEEWLSKCFDSILEQTFTNYEVIVVDDMSTDHALGIAFQYVYKFRNKAIPFKVIRNESKRYSGGSRNVGILASEGEYILCIDCDDWLYNNQVLEDIDKKLNGEDIMFLDYITHQKTYDLVMNNRNKTIDDALKNLTCAIWSKVVKRDLMLKSLFPEGTLFEDRIQHFIVLLNAKTITNLEKPVVVWNRLNVNSTSASNNEVWNTYRFNYIGELFRLYKTLNDGWFKEAIRKEIDTYMGYVVDMVNEL